MSRNVSKELKVRAAKTAPVAEQARGPHETAEPAQELRLLGRDPLAGLPAPPPSAGTVAGHAARLNRTTEGRISRAGRALRQLQRQYGNRYVRQVVAQARAGAPARPALAVQPKLVLGPVGDQYEREADRAARQVVGGMRASPSQAAGQAAQRQADGDGPAVAPELEAAIRGAKGGGQPLPDRVRTRMEQALGADFSRVRVHADPQADQLNQAIQARAFTTGQDVFFRQGAYAPESQGGQALLAHELTHVVQQTAKAPTTPLTAVQRMKISGLPSTDVPIRIGGTPSRRRRKNDHISTETKRKITLALHPLLRILPQFVTRPLVMKVFSRETSEALREAHVLEEQEESERRARELAEALELERAYW
jgi:hypothetical protein